MLLITQRASDAGNDLAKMENWSSKLWKELSKHADIDTILHGTKGQDLECRAAKAISALDRVSVNTKSIYANL